MSLYSLALFLHIVGALALFALLTIEGLSLRQGTRPPRISRMLGPISGLLVLVPGLYMSATSWGWQGWILVSLVSWLLLAAGGAFTGIQLMRGRLDRQTATVSWLVRVGMALGVVFVMTVKPAAVVAVAVVVIGGIAAGAAGVATKQVKSA
jgi:hypothetical protein